jgi:hypothetical protein
MNEGIAMICAARRRGRYIPNSYVVAGLIWILWIVHFSHGQTTSSKEIIYMNGKAIATESGDGSLAGVFTPQSLSATYLSGNQTEVQWCTGAYAAAAFEIEKIPGGTIQISGGQGCLSWTDTNVSSGTTYAYRIRAKDVFGNAGSWSNRDIATAMAFSSDPIAAGNTTIMAQHFSELRQSVASVRTCANLGAPSWTDANLSGATIKAIHLTEIRNQLNQALDYLNVPRPGYTDPTIVAGSTIVRAAHVQEIRDKVR